MSEIIELGSAIVAVLCTYQYSSFVPSSKLLCSIASLFAQLFIFTVRCSQQPLESQPVWLQLPAPGRGLAPHGLPNVFSPDIPDSSSGHTTAGEADLSQASPLAGTDQGSMPSSSVSRASTTDLSDWSDDLCDNATMAPDCSSGAMGQHQPAHVASSEPQTSRPAAAMGARPAADTQAALRRPFSAAMAAAAEQLDAWSSDVPLSRLQLSDPIPKHATAQVPMCWEAPATFRGHALSRRLTADAWS
jgi:hypothetical protein